MVPLRLAGPGPAAVRAAAGSALALILLTACTSRDRQEADAETETASVIAERVRARYRTGDAEAAGAWTWTSPGEMTFVLVDVQASIAGIVQARLDLWLVTDSSEMIVGRSDVMPSAAEIGAFTVGDLTGDGLPDLFGYVADPAGVRYPVFLPGAQGSLIDELAAAAPGWRFDAQEPHEPAAVAGMAGPCALQLWVEAPAPDGHPAGWRWLLMLRDGRLAPPAAEEPVCP